MADAGWAGWQGGSKCDEERCESARVLTLAFRRLPTVPAEPSGGSRVKPTSCAGCRGPGRHAKVGEIIGQKNNSLDKYEMFIPSYSGGSSICSLDTLGIECALPTVRGLLRVSQIFVL